MRILTFTTLFPNREQPHFAPFVRTRMEAYRKRHPCEWEVIAPIPWVPKIPAVKWPGRYGLYARMPELETDRGYSIHHPAYLVTPKFGMRFYARWMASACLDLVQRLHSAKPFDLIDAHYVYPDGVAAAMIGERLGIPVVISARGTDLNLFPDFAPIRKLIQKGLGQSRGLICVSQGLKEKAIALGLPESKATVIPNGVDGKLFYGGSQAEARQKLALPPDQPLILSVGNLIELKGFHWVIEALAKAKPANALYCIAGAGPERKNLEALAEKLGVKTRVRFLGSIPNAQLGDWYRAADVYALASSREGWPNVLTEAQACGLPAVSTRLPGPQEIIRNASLGILVDRTTPSIQQGLEQALAASWNRPAIALEGGRRTWEQVADDVHAVFLAALGRASP